MAPSEQEVPCVLIVVYSLARGGAERVTAELARAWAEQGWNVTVVTLAPVATDFFALDPRVTRIDLQLLNSGQDSLTPLKKNVRRICATRRLMRQIKPDAALGMMSTSAILVALAGIGLPGRRYGSERIFPPMMPLRPGRGAMRTLAYGLLDGVVCQTNAAAAWVQEHTWARAVPVAPNPILLPLPRLKPEICPSDLLASDDLCLLAVGRFSHQKQFDRLIATFARLATHFAGWKLVILGDGPDRAVLEAQVDAAGLRERVLLPGASGNVGDWYSRADLFVMTSRFEGFPNVLLEALAHGTPAISLDCLAGPADIIEHNQNGLLIPADDFDALEEALSRVMSNSDLRAQLAANASAVNVRFGRDRVMSLWNQALGLPHIGVAALTQKLVEGI